MNEFITSSPEETTALGVRIGSLLPKGSVVALHGDLAAGKTTLIKGLLRGIDPSSKQNVTSPTFVYLNIYDGPIPVHHFDLYRLTAAEQFLSMGFEEYLSRDAITCIEWAEKIEELLPQGTLTLTLEHCSRDFRKITLSHPIYGLNR